MFYEEEFDKVLRFGDVVRGYINSALTIKQPILSNTSEEHSYKIEIEVPQYSVVLTPCCSIGDNKIVVSPLIKLLRSFLKNSYFADDLLRINKKMTAEQSMPDSDWKKLSAEKQAIRSLEGEQYALTEYFVYAEDDIFEEYPLGDKSLRYYMVDFRNLQTLNCSMIKRPEMFKDEYMPILESKMLQLTIDARELLREKLAEYYGRVPVEDKIAEG